MIPRSSRLLTSLITAKEFTVHELADQLLVSVAVLEQYLSATMIMPLSRQMLLANFVVAKSKSLKRAGIQLHAQVVAATALHAKRTETHSSPPPTWTRRRPR